GDGTRGGRRHAPKHIDISADDGVSGEKTERSSGPVTISRVLAHQLKKTGGLVVTTVSRHVYGKFVNVVGKIRVCDRFICIFSMKVSDISVETGVRFIRKAFNHTFDGIEPCLTS